MRRRQGLSSSSAGLPSNHITVTVGSDESVAPGATVGVNGGSASKLPATVKVAKGDKVTLTGAMINDVDFTVAGWKDTKGKILAEGNTLEYTVSGNVSVVLSGKRISSENLALGAKVTSNSGISGGDWEWKNLTDGIYTGVSGALGFTSGSTNTDQVSHWVEINLGKNTDFNRVKLYPRSDIFAADGTVASFPVDFEIQVRAEGESAYTAVASFTDFEKPYGKPAVIEFAPVNARYVRLTVSRVGAPPVGEPYYLQLAEMGVYKTK